MITSSLESPLTTCNHPVQLQVSFHGFSQLQICGNDEDDNDDYDHGSQDAGPLRWMWSHMTIMMVLMTNDHSDFDLNLDLQDAGPLGWLPSPQPDLHGLSVPGCQPGQG